jgi:autotransporter-associated beta strand protein
MHQAISGTGALAKLGAGTLTLTGGNTYSGTTTISAGTLEVGSGGTAGRLGTGAVSNSGTLQINRSDNLTLANGARLIGNRLRVGYQSAPTTTVTGASASPATVRQRTIAAPYAPYGGKRGWG